MTTRLGAILSLLLATTIWGTAFVVTKAALDEVPPLFFAFIRYGIGAVVLLALVLVARRGGVRYSSGEWGMVLLMALSGVTLHFAAQTLSLANTSASVGALIQGTIPAITAAFGVVFLGERLSRARGFGIAASVLGVAMIVLAGGTAAGGANPLLGNLLMLAACFSWSFYTIIAKRMAHMPQIALAAYVNLLGSAMLIPGAGYELMAGMPVRLSAEVWLGALYLGAFASGLNLFLWNRALKELDASVAGDFINLVPVVGVISAALLLGERPAPLQLAGGLLVLTGVWISSRPSRMNDITDSRHNATNSRRFSEAQRSKDAKGFFENGD